MSSELPIDLWDIVLAPGLTITPLVEFVERHERERSKSNASKDQFCNKLLQKSCTLNSLNFCRPNEVGVSLGNVPSRSNQNFPVLNADSGNRELCDSVNTIFDNSTTERTLNGNEKNTERQADVRALMCLNRGRIQAIGDVGHVKSVATLAKSGLRTVTQTAARNKGPIMGATAGLAIGHPLIGLIASVAAKRFQTRQAQPDSQTSLHNRNANTADESVWKCLVDGCPVTVKNMDKGLSAKDVQIGEFDNRGVATQLSNVFNPRYSNQHNDPFVSLELVQNRLNAQSQLPQDASEKICHQLENTRLKYDSTSNADVNILVRKILAPFVSNDAHTTKTKSLITAWAQNTVHPHSNENVSLKYILHPNDSNSNNQGNGVWRSIRPNVQQQFEVSSQSIITKLQRILSIEQALMLQYMSPRKFPRLHISTCDPAGLAINAPTSFGKMERQDGWGLTLLWYMFDSTVISPDAYWSLDYQFGVMMSHLCPDLQETLPWLRKFTSTPEYVNSHTKWTDANHQALRMATLLRMPRGRI